ncbi:MAG: polysaccharide biosynthesis tyrosine autokinase [Acidobacteria bacterium]|nr:polysaccharide biosynthesis tyrosine autokinase [Acidobacteriota bacterium]
MSAWEIEPLALPPASPMERRPVREAALLAFYGAAIARWRHLVVGAALLGAGLGWLVPAMQAPRWEALALLEIALPNERFLELDAVDPSADQAASFRTRLQTQVRLLESRSLAELAAERLRGEDTEAAWDEVARTLDVRAGDDSRILELRAEAPEPDQARRFLETLIAASLDSARERREAEAVATEQWFQGRQTELEKRLRESELALQEAARLATLIPASVDRREAAEADLRRIEEHLSESRAEALALRARNEASAWSDAPGDPLGAYRRELETLLRRRAELAAIYTAEHHLLQQVEAEIGVVKTSLEEAENRLQAELGQALRETERRVGLLEEERTRRLEMLSEAAAAAVRYDILQRQVSANRDLYQSFLDHGRKAGVAVRTPVPSLRVVDPPAAGEEPLGPNPPLGALAGLLAGLGLSIAGAVLAERLDQTFRRPGDLGSALSIRELGAIPDARCEPSTERWTAAIGAAAPADPRPELAASRQGSSLLAESIRAVRTSLLMEGRPSSSRGLVWAVTSPSQSDGKTTIAANLALSMAELERKVLLVDADLRRPRLHRIFEAANRSGFSDLLTPQEPSDEQIDQAIAPMPGASHLHLLPSGVAPFGGPGLLHSGAADRLLERLRSRFDVIIVDTPPALAVSDARVLARCADGVVLVVRAGSTGGELAAEADSLLRADGAHMLGAVLNSWNPRDAGRRRYKAYFQGPQAA